MGRNVNEILADRAKVVADQRAILDEIGENEWTGEQEKKYQDAESVFSKLTDELRKAETEAREKELATPQSEGIRPTGERAEAHDEREAAYEDAFYSFLRGGMDRLKPEQRSVLETGFMPESRAQGTTSGAVGGFLVPEGFRRKLQESLKTFGGMLEVAEVIRTDSGNSLPWPTNDDTANKGAILAENTQVTEQDVVIGQKLLGAFMYTSKLVRVSFQLLQDSAFELEGWLRGKLSQRIGRILNEHFTTGVGTTMPEGVQTNATIGKTGATGQTLTVTYDDLIDLIYSVDPAYRGNGRFMLNDLSVAKIRKIRDDSGGAGLGRPIWEPSLQAGEPDTLIGYPVVNNQDMPVMAANARSILFGDFRAGYVARLVTDVQMLRLQERYADFLQVGFLGFQRADGLPQDTAAVKAYRNSAT